MRKTYAALAGAMTLLVAAACSDRTAITDVGERGLTPKGASHTIVNGGGFTTVNETADGTGHCANGNPAVNCNIYDGKQFVWLNGGPAAATIGGAGNYLFAVLSPAGQNSPNDNTTNNLSDQFGTPGGGDSYLNRVYTIGADGSITYTGTHDVDQPVITKIRLAPYDDTPNQGGVYIMAICAVGDAILDQETHAVTGYTGYPILNPSACKYDAFKINTSGGTNGSEVLTVSKTATGSFTRTYAWNISKSASPTLVEQIGGNVTVTYNVVVSRNSAGDTDGSYAVSGTITVSNPNPDNVHHVTVTDALSDGTSCQVTDGSDVTVGPGDTNFSYTCALAAAPATGLTNIVTANWTAQTLTSGDLPAGPAHFESPAIVFSQTASVNATVNVTDLFNGGTAVAIGTLLNPTGTSTVTLATAPRTFTYTRSISVTTGCHDYPNIAAITETGQTANASVRICGPGNEGGLTIGFWKGPNGNSLIANYCAQTNKTSLATFLSGLGAGSGPFADAAGNCSALVTYVNGILNGASATNMNAMHKAQMLGTALDVYFTDATKGYSTVGTSSGKTQIKPPSAFLPGTPIGGFNMDMTAICPMVDNTTTGTATCLNTQPSTNAFASGAVPNAAMLIQVILNYAATTTSPFNGVTGSGSIWYAGDRTKQEILKNVFDQINNNDAFAPLAP